MRTFLILTVIASVGATGAAFAANGATSASQPQNQSTSIDAIKTRMEAMGYDVRHAKQADDCYHLRLVERQSGGEVKATFDKTSGELVAAESGGKRQDARPHEEAKKERDARAEKKGEHSRPDKHHASSENKDRDDD